MTTIAPSGTMERYRVVHTSRQIGDSTEASDPALWGWPVDGESTFVDALFLARLYAQEHAGRIDVEVADIEFGAEFTTNNGTLVRYEVVGHTPRD